MNNILTELVPRKVRLWLYVIAFFASGAFAAWQVAEGDWLKFAAAVLALVLSALAASNVTPPPDPGPPDPLPVEPQATVEPSEQPPSAAPTTRPTDPGSWL